MSKYDILGTVAGKIQALDNEVKLKILALLVEEGSKSITDISKDLSINFSTAHKYLEQLEAAELVASKQISENRMKRMFTIKDFDLALSPAGISGMINGATAKETKSGLKVINEKGELVSFDEKIFSQKYLKRGMPRGTIAAATSVILENSYDGITLLELRRMFKQELEKKAEIIHVIFKQISDDERHKRTYAHLMSEVHSDALDLHANGQIFIKNLREPKLQCFVHDLRGLTVHGYAGKRINSLSDFLSGALFVMGKLNTMTCTHVLDAFNFCLAPFAANTTKQELETQLRKFFNEVEKLGTKTFCSLDIGSPRFSKMHVYYLSENKESDPQERYAKYEASANDIAKIIIKILKSDTKKIISTVVKVWPKADINMVADAHNIYVANMRPAWQGINASYAGPFARFDSSWKHWLGTQRVGELQSIAINLPSLVATVKTEQEFLDQLKIMMNKIIEYIHNMMDLTMADFFRKRDTYLESMKQNRWNYVPIENCTFSVALSGIDDAVFLLSGKTLEKNSKFAEKIIELCETQIQSASKIPIRINLKEEFEPAILSRFYNINLRSGIILPKYSLSIKAKLGLHKFLSGGHCSTIAKSQLETVLNSDFGLIFIEK